MEWKHLNRNEELLIYILRGKTERCCRETNYMLKKKAPRYTMVIVRQAMRKREEARHSKIYHRKKERK